MIHKYKKKPEVVEAVQFVDTEECLNFLKSWSGLDLEIDHSDIENPYLKLPSKCCERKTITFIEVGAYISKSSSENLFARSQKYFENNYNLIENDSNN